MKTRHWHQSRFDRQDDEPLGPLANLVDIMLVFACGLIAALFAEGITPQTFQGGEVIEKGRELPEVPQGIGEAGGGFKPVGKVFRDPRTGKLILIGEPTNE